MLQQRIYSGIKVNTMEDRLFETTTDELRELSILF